jgi:hypothetical protein
MKQRWCPGIGFSIGRRLDGIEGAARRHEASGDAGLLRHCMDVAKSTNTVPAEIELHKDSNSGFIVHVDDG